MARYPEAVEGVNMGFWWVVENFDGVTVVDDANVVREVGMIVSGDGWVLVPMVLVENVAVVVVGVEIQECHIQMVAKEEEDAKAQVMEAVVDVTEASQTLGADLVMKVRAGVGMAVSYVNRQAVAVVVQNGYLVILFRWVGEVGKYNGSMIVVVVVVVVNNDSGLMTEVANCNVLMWMVAVVVMNSGNDSMMEVVNCNVLMRMVGVGVVANNDTGLMMEVVVVVVVTYVDRWGFVVGAVAQALGTSCKLVVVEAAAAVAEDASLVIPFQ